MDVKELMAFKPAHTPKRPAPGEVSRAPEELTDDDPTDSYEARAKKRKLAMKKAQEVGESFFVSLFAGSFSFVRIEFP